VTVQQMKDVAEPM